MTENPSAPPDLAVLHKASSPTIPTKITSTSTAQASQPGYYRAQLLEQGYVVVPGLLPPHLLLASQASCKYLVSRTRPGGFWPHVRTVPKQFPPWPQYTSESDHLNIWGIQHLLHPKLSGLRDVFAEVYFSEDVLRVVRDILSPDAIHDAYSETTKNGSSGGRTSATDGSPSTTNGPSTSAAELTNDDLVMELFNLLISPVDTDFELIWHRDDVRPDLSPDEELRQIHQKAPNGRQVHAQYNLALFEDESLIVVPGSHRRTRTDTERNAGPHDVLPDELHVKLNPGDAVFYDSNIWHRGRYKGIGADEMGRMTLHGSVGLKGYGEERSRQVLQHGVGEWVETDDALFSNIQDGTKKMTAETMRKNLIDMGRGKGQVGYSLEG